MIKTIQILFTNFLKDAVFVYYWIDGDTAQQNKHNYIVYD